MNTDYRQTIIVTIALMCVGLVYLFGWTNVFAVRMQQEGQATTNAPSVEKARQAEPAALDTADYDRRMQTVANCPPVQGTSTPQCLWPTTTVRPLAGALLPFKRIIAYYGNFYSTRMGVLGEYPEAQMLAMLRKEQNAWEAADPTTPTVPAINYIAITAQGSPGKEGNYMLRMPDSEVDKAVVLAQKINGIVILDIQIGHSDLSKELPLLDKYWAMPNVHLGLDPEFHMQGTVPPGDEIGTYDANDINYAATYLGNFVRTNNLPPKVIVVHRFTEKMVTNYKDIKPLPEVQIVMDMDGWGPPANKLNAYKRFMTLQPVQFTGFKLFYKNDLKPPSERLLTPAELIKLTPRPSFIQYQ